MGRKILFRNVRAIVTCDPEDRILKDADLLIEGNRIVRMGTALPAADDVEVIDGKNLFIYPGLVNTHHHLLQAFTRNIPAIQNSELFDWLMYLYNVWMKVTPEYLYYSSMVAMGEFAKYGGTTMFDQHFAFPRGAGKNMLDRQFDAAADIGLRFHAGRSSFNRGKSNGGLPPDELVETLDEVLNDTRRLIETYHDPEPFSMRQVVVSPCSPFSVDSDIMRESARMGRAMGVRLHTHLCETLDEEDYCLEVYGKRPLAWAEECEWVGDDVWFAHGIHFTDEEITGTLAPTKTGVAHNPVSNMKLSSGICKVPLMLEHGVPVGLALDGCGSNDASNLLADIRSAFLIHRHTWSDRAPSGYEILKLATMGSAELLGRSDIGSLEEGKAADLFAIDVDQLEFVGALMDPGAILATIGHARPVKMTMVNGEIVWMDGEFANFDEERIRREATEKVAEVYRDL